MQVRSKKSLTFETQDESNDYCEPLAQVHVTTRVWPRDQVEVARLRGARCSFTRPAIRHYRVISLTIPDLAFPRRLNVLSGTAAIMVTPIILHVDWPSHQADQEKKNLKKYVQVMTKLLFQFYISQFHCCCYFIIWSINSSH